jgi:site-specific DNA recombinase
MRIAALYARVSGEQQRDSHTIASQTEALVAYAERHGYRVAPDMIIEDDGYSGAVLERPGLERVRDLAAEGRIDTVVAHAPDRLSRRYAYQVVIIEELARQGVETVFVNAPSMETPEDHLLVQFQGMIAEYERAQILERSRRGKRHRARRGEVAVLSGAPYGYRYHKKTPDSDAFYEVIEPQASVVREVYRCYTHDHMSIGAITHRLKEREVPTATGRSRWERSTVWAILRNPAYKGTACFGKTRQMPRKSVTRPVRLSGGFASATTGSHEKPREEWIEIPVPAIVSEETFALAEERLERNKIHAPRRTKTLSVVQGLVSCGKCGYAWYRTSAQTSARKISYYRCLGSDSWRHLNGPLCDSRPVRQELLDDVVWTEVVRLLENPALISSEIDRRLEAARASDPNQQREADLRRRLIRVRKSIDRLVNAYQEELITIDELRDRTPELRRQEQALHRELQSAVDQAKERETYLRLAETLTDFLERLRSSAETLDIAERQRIVRLLVKEVLVSEDKITIRHSIPISGSPGGGPDPSTSATDGPEGEGYLLRSGRHFADAFQHLPAPCAGRVVRESGEAAPERTVPTGEIHR